MIASKINCKQFLMQFQLHVGMIPIELVQINYIVLCTVASHIS